MAATDGDERVIAAAHHIVRSLGTDEYLADDMLRILSNFDGRFSSMNQKNRNQEIALLPGPIPLELSTVHLPSIENAGRTVMKWDMVSSKVARRSMIWDCHGKEAASYLHAVDELQDSMGSLSISRREKSTFDRAQSFLQSAMARLEEEFRHLLVKHSDSVDPEWILESVLGPFPRSSGDEGTPEAASRSSGDEEADEDIPVANLVTDLNLTIDLLPAEVVSDLNEIAQRMIAGGYGRECCQVYASVRKAVLQQSLYRLGVEKLSTEDIHKMTWESLEERIKKWVQAMKVAVKVLFPSEKILCGQVFAGMNPWLGTSFADSAKASMIQLLSFAEAIAISRRSPEKLFKILDMYETLWELLPDINSIFCDDFCSNVRSEVNGILVRLGEAARGTFAEFENAIQRDTSKIPVPRGAVHPLTRYVMNYIWLLFSYAGTLKRLLGHKKEAAPKLMGLDTHNFLENSTEDETNTLADHLSPLAVQIIWLTVLLECNLDGKSKLYKDIAQTYLFLMNNVHYIVQKVKQSELASLVGEDWVRKHSGQVRQYATNYVRAAWKKVLACLRDDGLSVSGSFSFGVSKIALKDRFKSFNAAFEELHRIQSTWVVPDPQLREELRSSIAEKLIPPYRCFLCRFQKYLESRRRPGKYIKYTPEDLESSLLDLFEGTSGPATLRRKSFSTS